MYNIIQTLSVVQPHDSSLLSFPTRTKLFIKSTDTDPYPSHKRDPDRPMYILVITNGVTVLFPSQTSLEFQHRDMW